MNIKAVAMQLLERIKTVTEEGTNGRRCIGDETSYPHLIWMLNGILIGYVEGRKAERWIGFVEGVMKSTGDASVDEYKQWHSETNT